VRARLADGAGNRFLLVDALAGPAPRDPAAAARAACARELAPGFRADGLLVLAPAQDADVAMVLYNADGSRPEACGNGLRCVALGAVLAGHVHGPRFTVATDAGVRAVRVEGGRVRVSVGAARIVDAARLVGGERGAVVDVGNPHFVLRRDAPAPGELARVGPLLATHADFPAGTNVELASVRCDGLDVRVWERGVGETRACGTGACAAALCAVELWGAAWPVQVDLPGGRLTVERALDGELWLGGPTEVGAACEVQGIE
jgi:diaminopimelate epimerase